MSPKQLESVSHLLSDEQSAEIALAARLPRINQGRKRHENRVAQLIRDGASDEVLEKLAVRSRGFVWGGARLGARGGGDVDDGWWSTWQLCGGGVARGTASSLPDG